MTNVQNRITSMTKGLSDMIGVYAPATNVPNSELMDSISAGNPNYVTGFSWSDMLGTSGNFNGNFQGNIQSSITNSLYLDLFSSAGTTPTVLGKFQFSSDGSFTYTPTALLNVPEPSTYALLTGFLIAGLLSYRRRVMGTR